MTVRVPVRGLREGAQSLGRDAAHYLTRVLRLESGAPVIAFDPDAHVEADARVEIGDGHVAVVVATLRRARVLAQRALVVVYGLAKGDKVDAVVRDATELGATHVLVTRTARAVVNLDPARARERIERWRRIAEQAARQCGRGDPPEVDGVFEWEDALTRAAGLATRCFCLHPTSPRGIELVHAMAADEGLAIAIGPEGGLTDDETAAAENRGFVLASLGTMVLRTETVVAATLGAVQILRGAGSVTV